MLTPQKNSSDERNLPHIELSGGVEISVLRLPASAHLWNLTTAYLELRRDIFISRKDWALWQGEDLEFDQYDTLDTSYVVAHRAGKVLGGGRLRRADQTTGRGQVIYSYMIRDAVLGLLPGLPEDLCFETPPVDETTWELTRFVNIGGVGVAAGMLRCINDYLFELGGKNCLCLGSPAFLRMARRVGWDVTPYGPLCGNESGRFLVFNCPVIDPANLPVAGIDRLKT